MNDEVIRVNLDRDGFAAEVASMRGTLESALGGAADRAGRGIEAALVRAARGGAIGFEDLRKVALGVLDDIARAALRQGLSALGLGGLGKGLGGGSGGLLGMATGLLGGLVGIGGRATGGPVAPGQAYRVGERGPEWFVPTSSGRVETALPSGGGARDVRIIVNVGGEASRDPQRFAASGRQVALAVKRALEGV